jgi:hypothetical protein
MRLLLAQFAIFVVIAHSGYSLLRLSNGDSSRDTEVLDIRNSGDGATINALTPSLIYVYDARSGGIVVPPPPPPRCQREICGPWGAAPNANSKRGARR